MKQPNSRSDLMLAPSRRHKSREHHFSLKVMILVIAFSPFHAHAQAAANSQKTTTANATDDANKHTETTTSRIEKSRYISEERLPEYFGELSAVLTASKRTVDPFGQIQDPDAKPIIRTPVATPNRVAPIQATPFSDIIRLIKVTTVMPSERKFLIGTRSLKEGDRLPLTYRGRELNVEVASVNSRAIQFRNIENGETAALTLDLLPPGMTPGTRGIKAFGMKPDRPDAPLDLDNNSDSTDASRSR